MLNLCPRCWFCVPDGILLNCENPPVVYHTPGVSDTDHVIATQGIVSTLDTAQQLTAVERSALLSS